MRWRSRWLKRLARARPMQGLFDRIARLNGSHAVLFVIAFFLIGRVADHYGDLEKLLVYQLLFIPAIVIAFADLKFFLQKMECYRMMTASHPNRSDGAFIIALIKSYWSLPGLIVLSTLYIYATISLEYISFDAAGYYALAMIVLIMISAILEQTCYVYYMLLLRRIARSEKLKYNFYFPARTDWVQLLAETGNRLSNSFFILGFIYTTVYLLNMPSHFVKISLSPIDVQLNTPNNFVFAAGWVTIFLIIILAFPVYAWLKSRYLKAIVSKLKATSLAELEVLMMRGNIRNKQDAAANLRYYQMTVNIEESAGTPNEGYDLLPIAATLSSMAVHIIKISESLP